MKEKNIFMLSCCKRQSRLASSEQADLQAVVSAQLITVVQGCISCVTVDLPHTVASRSTLPSLEWQKSIDSGRAISIFEGLYPGSIGPRRLDSNFQSCTVT